MRTELVGHRPGPEKKKVRKEEGVQDDGANESGARSGARAEEGRGEREANGPEEIGGDVIGKRLRDMTLPIQRFERGCKTAVYWINGKARERGLTCVMRRSQFCPQTCRRWQNSSDTDSVSADSSGWPSSERTDDRNQ